ncbi:MAG: class I SAM-dependent methyltransferase [Tenuifilaceae bacterium]
MEEQEYLTCKICGNKENNTEYTAREMMFGFRDEFNYYQCNNCQCLQIESFPENISKYYPEGYYSFKEHSDHKFKGVKGIFSRLQYNSAIFKNNPFQKLIHFLLPTKKYDLFESLKINKKTRILDVGCGNGGKFLYPLAEIGFTNLLGCDPYINKPITYSNSLSIFKTDIFQIVGEWDIITFHHSFEHSDSPAKTLIKASELMSKNGVCIIRIPTVSSYAWEHYKTNWFQLDAPRHYFLHSIKSIELLAKQAGLKLTSVIYDSTHHQFSDSEKYINDTTLRDPRPKGFINFIKRKIKKYNYQRITKKLNKQKLGDQAIFYLRKSN